MKMNYLLCLLTFVVVPSLALGDNETRLDGLLKELRNPDAKKRAFALSQINSIGARGHRSLRIAKALLYRIGKGTAKEQVRVCATIGIHARGAMLDPAVAEGIIRGLYSPHSDVRDCCHGILLDFRSAALPHLQAAMKKAKPPKQFAIAALLGKLAHLSPPDKRVVEVLAAGLRSKDKNKCRQAQSGLARISSVVSQLEPRFVENTLTPTLVEAISIDNDEVQRMSCYGLAQCGKYAVPFVKKMLASRQTEQIAKGCRVVSQMTVSEQAQFMPTLLSRLKDSRTPTSTQLMILKSLSKLPESTKKHAKKLRKILDSFLTHPSKELKILAAETLFSLDSFSVETALVLLESSDKSLRLSAIKEFYHRTKRGESFPSTVPTVIEFLDTDDLEFRKWSIYLLKSTSARTAVRLKPNHASLLLKAFVNESEQNRSEGLAFLIGRWCTPKQFFDAMKGRKKPLDLGFMTVLYRFVSEKKSCIEALPRVYELAESESDDVRRYAFSLLGTFLSDSAITAGRAQLEFLVLGLRDSNEDVRSVARDSIKQVGVRAIRVMEDVLNSTNDDQLRREIALAVKAMISDQFPQRTRALVPFMPALALLLHHPDESVRQAGAAAVQRLAKYWDRPSDRLLRMLVMNMHHPSEAIRTHALWALAHLRSGAVEVLVLCLDSASLECQQAACSAIRIMFQDHGIRCEDAIPKLKALSETSPDPKVRLYADVTHRTLIGEIR